MKTHVSNFHLKYLTQVFKLDLNCTTAHFKAVSDCLQPFIQSISDAKQVQVNEEFSINIIGILALCASHQYYNHYFVNNYLNIIHYIIPLFKLN